MLKPPRPKKRWGQNFFTDSERLREALEPVGLEHEDLVLEIGPGRGILTSILLEQTQAVRAFEIDPELCPLLKAQFEQAVKAGRLEVLQQDFMHYHPAEFHPEAPLERRKLIANIPYHLTSPILLKILNEPGFKQGIDTSTPYFSDICLMVQKEVADKLLDEPGGENWSALSLSVNYAAEVQLLDFLPRQLFDPPPKVDSALIWLQPRTQAPVELNNPSLFWLLVARCFQMRRKTLRNVCKSFGLGSEALESLQSSSDIDLGRRGETLSLQEMATLANQLAASS